MCNYNPELHLSDHIESDEFFEKFSRKTVYSAMETAVISLRQVP